MNKYKAITRLFLLIVVSCAIINLKLIVDTHMKLTERSKQYTTLRDCANSRNSGDYKQCYGDEAKYNTEYVCNSTAMDCWVETH